MKWKGVGEGEGEEEGQEEVHKVSNFSYFLAWVLVWNWYRLFFDRMSQKWGWARP